MSVKKAVLYVKGKSLQLKLDVCSSDPEGFPTVYIMGDCRWEACIRDTVERFNPDYMCLMILLYGLPRISIRELIMRRDRTVSIIW